MAMFSDRRIIAVLGLGAIATLSACSSVDPGLGEALKYNMALQTVNPTPVYGLQGSQPGDDGEKGQKATERYRTDHVKDVEMMTTTSGVSGGGGGAGMSSGGGSH